MQIIRVLLVDDQPLICEGLQAMLSLEADLEVIGVAANGQAAVDLVKDLSPDVVLMDIRMPIMDGREATRLIIQSFPEVKVLVLSTFDDDQYITDAMKAGAKGYLLKATDVEEIAQVIRSVYNGFVQLGPNLIEKLIAGLENSSHSEAISNTEDINQILEKITPREREVLEHLRWGETNREIACKLYVSEGTVKSHVSHLLESLGVRTRAQLAILSNSIFSNKEITTSGDRPPRTAQGNALSKLGTRGSVRRLSAQ